MLAIIQQTVYNRGKQYIITLYKGRDNMNKYKGLTASNAGEWTSCPAGFMIGRKNAELIKNPAEAGKAAHELAQILLKGHAGQGDSEALQARYQNYKKHSIHYSPEVESMAREYSDYCADIIKQAKRADDRAVILVEERLPYSDRLPGQTGSIDFAVIAAGVLYIADMKSGATVVSAKDNAQLKMYAVAVINKYYAQVKIDKIIMTIVQTRYSTVSTDTTTQAELVQWWREATQRIEGLNLKDHEDKHCSHCGLKSNCRHSAEHMLKQAGYILREDAQIDYAEEYGAIAEEMQALIERYNRLNEAARQYSIERGIPIKGCKIVEGAPGDDQTITRKSELVLLNDKRPGISLADAVLHDITKDSLSAK